MQRTNREVNPSRPRGAGGYDRYRQPPPRKRRKKRRRGGFGKLLAVLLVVALAAGFAAWYSNLRRERLLRETLRTYPLAYRELIRQYAGEQGLEPCYIAAIVMSESSFQPDATSSVNAQGLMQIMPSTGEWIAGKFGDAYAEGCLYDPATNLRYGCWYMGFLMDRYDGDKACSSAAYHSGQGEVDGWLDNPAYSPDGRTLATIPGENANTYVERVLRYYEKYKEIYGVNLTEHEQQS